MLFLGDIFLIVDNDLIAGGTGLSSIIPALAPAPLVSNESSILRTLEPQNLGVAPSVGAPAPAASGRRLLGFQRHFASGGTRPAGRDA